MPRRRRSSRLRPRRRAGNLSRGSGNRGGGPFPVSGRTTFSDYVRAGAVGLYARTALDADRLRRIVRAVAANEAAIPRSMVLELLLELRGRGNGADALTARESQVLGMLRRGHSTAEIAERLAIAPVTVRRHISRARAQAGRREPGRADARRLALYEPRLAARGFIAPPSGARPHAMLPCIGLNAARPFGSLWTSGRRRHHVAALRCMHMTHPRDYLPVPIASRLRSKRAVRALVTLESLDALGASEPSWPRRNASRRRSARCGTRSTSCAGAQSDRVGRARAGLRACTGRPQPERDERARQSSPRRTA